MIEISANKRGVIFNLGELFKYRTLIKMFIKRDFVVFYKQTILGPIWYLIQPLANTIVFTIIFGNIAKIPTDSVPPFLFYMSGTIIWSYFATCLSLNSNIFTANSDLFGKVYFPKLTVPVAHVTISVLQFLIQFSLFLSFLIYYSYQGATISFSLEYLIIPVLVLYTALISIAFGSLISSLTAKYRDLTFALSFMIQLWMYATPIVYPTSIVPEKYLLFFKLNPMTFVVESFRGIFFDNYNFILSNFVYSFVVTLLILFLGLFYFKKTEKNFMDTV